MTRSENPNHALIALVPALLFYILDSYYLALERSFIKSYDTFVASLHEGSLASSAVYAVKPTGMGWRAVVWCFLVFRDAAILFSIDHHNSACLVGDLAVKHSWRVRRDLAKQRTPRHRVFISYHDEDRDWKAKFSRQMGEHIIDRSVKIGNIDDTNIKTETIRQRIRDNFLRDSSVTVVLIGPCTWRRMHVDWEIGSSLRDTKRTQGVVCWAICIPIIQTITRKCTGPG